MILDANPWALISPPINRAVDTNVDTALSSEEKREPFHKEWQAVEGTLIDWGCNPSQFEDDIVPPQRPIIKSAIQYASDWCKNGLPAPARVVPDVRGGIVFEFIHENGTSSIHIHANGRIELRVFSGHQLVFRSILDGQ